jgi:hypothetical protein
MIRQLFSTLAIFAIGVTIGVGNAGAQTICDGRLAPGTYASVTVPAGKSCAVQVNTSRDVVTVTGNVTVAQGATLLAQAFDGQFIVNGNLKGGDARLISLVAIAGPPSRIEIDGNVTLSGTTGLVDIASVSSIGGNFQVVDGAGAAVKVGGSNVSGNVLFLNNTTNGAGAIFHNTIGGNLVCQDNTPPPTNARSPNTVLGNEIGQCEGL